MVFQTTLFLDSGSAESGSSGNFSVYYNPPIELDINKTYELALISADLWYSWHNIKASNNKFRYSNNSGTNWYNLTLTPGAYNVTDINTEIKRLIKANGHEPDNVTITPNYNTLKSRLTLANGYQVDFTDATIPSNLRVVLGFKSKLINANGDHDSDNPVNITTINTVQIRCDLISSSYINGSSTDIVHSFSPTVPPGYLLNIQPRNLIYLPINRKSIINSITIRITDQSGNNINLNGERTTFYISLREQRSI